MAQIKARINVASTAAEVKKHLDKIRHLNVFITEIIEPHLNVPCDGPLKNLRVALKDNFCTKNVKTTCGSRMLEFFLPTYDCTVWQRLQKAGCILVGKTNLDEFGMGSGTCDSFFGATKNPWGKNVQHIAGGSSGGTAVAVATGCAEIGIGSDTGGSTRNPASYCGVLGFKPTYGTVSRHGLIPLVNSMDVPGIMARNINLIADTYKAIGGKDPMDSTTVEKFPKISNLDGDIKNLRIGIPKEYFPSSLSPEIYNEWLKLADKMENCGARVTQVSLPHTADSIFVYSILNQCEVASNMARYDGLRFGYRAKNDTSTEELFAATREHGFNNVVKSRILAGNYFLLRRNYQKYFEKALKVRRLISNDFKKVYENVDVLLTPTTLTTAPTFGEFTRENNRDQCAQQDFCTQPANMAGIPAISIPVALSQNEMPISLQLMAPMFGENVLFNATKWIENEVNFARNYERIS